MMDEYLEKVAEVFAEEHVSGFLALGVRTDGRLRIAMNLGLRRLFQEDPKIAQHISFAVLEALKKATNLPLDDLDVR